MASASGSPTSKALVVTTHTAFPASFPPQVAQVVEVFQVETIFCLVAGDTMSFSAYRRCPNVSSCGLYRARARSNSASSSSTSAGSLSSEFASLPASDASSSVTTGGTRREDHELTKALNVAGSSLALHDELSSSVTNWSFSRTWDTTTLQQQSSQSSANLHA